MSPEPDGPRPGAAPFIDREATRPIAMAEAVGWFSLRTLYATGSRAFLTMLFGERSGRRELLAALDAPRMDAVSALAHSDGYFDHSGAGQDEAPSEVWIDYAADIGDGFDATHSISWLIGRDFLFLDEPGRAIGQPIPADSRTEAGPDAVPNVAHVLPGGQVLILGGDLVYPYASQEYYYERTYGPYWAARPWGSAVADRNSPKGMRAVYAIPGNHDWYDGLISFARYFCQPKRWIGCWQVQQKRSYFALKLPQGFWLWGIDTFTDDDIDQPQQAYFEQMAALLGPNDQVILCIPDPTWINCVADGAQEESRSWDGDRKTERLLALVTRPDGAAATVPVILTGDLHHYVHHISTGADEAPARHYVICGGGGAFMLGTTGTPHVLTFQDGKTAALTHAFPSRAESAAMRNGVFKIVWKHKPFCAAIGLVMAWLFWLSHSTSNLLAAKAVSGAPSGGPDLTSFWSTFAWCADDLADGVSLTTLVGAPSLVLAVVIISALFVANALSGALHSVDKRPALAAGGLHFLAQFGVGLGLAALGRTLVLTIGTHPVLLSLLLALPALAAMIICHGLVVAAYIRLSNVVCGLHERELYSSQAIEDWKCFLRMKVDHRGLTIFPIGLRTIERQWRRASDKQAVRSSVREKIYKAAGAGNLFGSATIPVNVPVGTTHIFLPTKALAPALIEKPFTIAPRTART